jgi:PH/SEC7 domain-containing protein
MSRSQFVRNTLTAIQMQIHSSRSGQASSVDLPHDDSSSFRGTGSDGTATITSRSKRSASITSWKSISRDAFPSSPTTTSPSTQSSSPNPNSSTESVQFPPGGEDKVRSSSTSSMVYGRNWESEMETLLKVNNLCHSIKSRLILIQGNVQRNQESANFTTSRYRVGCSELNVFEPWWNQP